MIFGADRNSRKWRAENRRQPTSDDLRSPRLLFQHVLIGLSKPPGGDRGAQGLSEWQTAQGIKTGTIVKVTFTAESREQVIVGRAAQLPRDTFPSIFAVVSNEGVFHMIDLQRISGTLEILPDDQASRNLESRIEIPRSMMDRLLARKPSELKKQKLVSDYLLKNDSQITDAILKIRGAAFLTAGSSLMVYTTLWDAVGHPNSVGLRPAWTNHFSNYIISAFPASGADTIVGLINTEKLRPKRTLLIATAAALVTVQAVLETKGIFPYSWSQFMGPNVRDMSDFYVGASTALLSVTLPELIQKGLIFVRRGRGYRSLNKCQLAFIGS